MIDINELTLPVVHALESTDTVGRYSLEPLERGYGITLGSTLRRVLQSSLPGRAVTTAKIDGVLSMNAEMPGIREDVTELLLNLKRLRFSSTTDEAVILRLDVTGEREVTAKDIVDTDEVKIVNPDLHIAMLTSKSAHLAMELTTTIGKGYLPSETGAGALTLGEFPLDAIFTPVEKVSYEVEHTLMGGSLNYDRLLLEVHTDGTIAPDDALRQAGDVLQRNFLVFASLGRDPNAVAAEAIRGVPETTSRIPNAVAEMSIDELDLSTRTHNALRRSNITKVGQLLQMSDDDLSAIRNFGSKSADEVREHLRDRGLS